MKTPKKILVPTDMSAYSLSALEYGEEVAKIFDAELTVVYVVDDGKHKETREQLDAELEKQSRMMISHMLVNNDLATRNINIVIRHGHAATEIVRAARDLQIDLIVLSTHGRTGLRHVLLGSVAEKVVRTATCPVLTVKPEEFRELVEITEAEVVDSLHLAGWEEEKGQ